MERSSSHPANRPAYDYAIAPILGERMTADPAIAAFVDDFLAREGFELAPTPPVVIGWQLQLRVEAVEVERTAFADDGFEDAQRAGGAWLEQHGISTALRWFACSEQALRRMDWDDDYRHELGKRSF